MLARDYVFLCLVSLVLLVYYVILTIVMKGNYVSVAGVTAFSLGMWLLIWWLLALYLPYT